MVSGAGTLDVESVPKGPIVLLTLHTAAHNVQMNKLHHRKGVPVFQCALQVGIFILFYITTTSSFNCCIMLFCNLVVRIKNINY